MFVEVIKLKFKIQTMLVESLINTWWTGERYPASPPKLYKILIESRLYMEYIPIELWINEDQEERWKKEANRLNISLFSYIRRAVDSFCEIKSCKENQNICKN